MIAPKTIIQLEIWYPAIDVFRLNHSITFTPQNRPPLSGIIIAKAGEVRRICDGHRSGFQWGVSHFWRLHR